MKRAVPNQSSSSILARPHRGLIPRLREFLFSRPTIRNEKQLRSTLQKLILARLAILTLLLGATVAHLLSDNAALVSDSLYFAIAAVYAISILNTLWLRRTKHVIVFGYGQLLVDVLLATLAIAVTQSAVAISLYLVVIIGGAFLFSSHGAVIVAAWAAVCYGALALGLIPMANSEHFSSSPSDFLAVYISLVSIALLGGYLARQLEHVGAIALSRTQDLNELLQRQHELFNDISEGILSVDLDGMILNVNQAALSVLGLQQLNSSRIVGHPLGELLSKVGVSPDAQILHCSLPTSTPQEITLLQGASGKEVHIRYTMRPLTGSDGADAGKMFLFNDISHIRSMEEQLQLHERMTKLLSEQTSDVPKALSDGAQLHMVGESPVMKQVFFLVERIASTDASVLITGESGTGKELIARAIHTQGPRKNRPFVAVNCGAIPENLIESELFGHKKGSFTGAIADNPGLFRQAKGGTIFLDEIGELPLHLQSKLLRVLQERRVRSVGETIDTEIDVRVLAATNKDLKAEIAAKQFREDLYYRLNVVNVLVPPLRSRKEDIPLLVSYFISKFSGPDQVLPRISPEAVHILMNHNFPGNIRELENIIERALVLGGQAILPEHLSEELQSSHTKQPQHNSPHGEQPETEIILMPVDLESVLAKLEQQYLNWALQEANGVKKHAADLLGLNFRSFRYRLKKYSLDDSESVEN